MSPNFLKILQALVDLIESKPVYVSPNKEILQESGDSFFENLCGSLERELFPDDHLCSWRCFTNGRPSNHSAFDQEATSNVSGEVASTFDACTDDLDDQIGTESGCDLEPLTCHGCTLI